MSKGKQQQSQKAAAAAKLEEDTRAAAAKETLALANKTQTQQQQRGGGGRGGGGRNALTRPPPSALAAASLGSSSGGAVSGVSGGGAAVVAVETSTTAKVTAAPAAAARTQQQHAAAAAKASNALAGTTTTNDSSGSSSILTAGQQHRRQLQPQQPEKRANNDASHKSAARYRENAMHKSLALKQQQQQLLPHLTQTTPAAVKAGAAALKLARSLSNKTLDSSSTTSSSSSTSTSSSSTKPNNNSALTQQQRQQQQQQLEPLSVTAAAAAKAPLEQEKFSSHSINAKALAKKHHTQQRHSRANQQHNLKRVTSSSSSSPISSKLYLLKQSISQQQQLPANSHQHRPLHNFCISTYQHNYNQHLIPKTSKSHFGQQQYPTNQYHNLSINQNTNNRKFSTSTKMADQAVIDKLEAGFAKLQASTPEQCHSLLKKYLTRDVLDKCKTRKTAMGATLLDVAQSGFENLDSGVGIYAPDAESYTLFAELFNPIIEDYHGGFKATDKHPASDFGDLSTLVNVDPDNQFVISTRVRCGRSLKGYPFNPCLTEAQYKEMQDKVSNTLKECEGELAGTYYPLTGMTKETQQQLIDDHFLFKEGDRFLQAANACRYWPTGRGIYHNKDKTFLVWVNEEDHLRIISMQKGGDLKTVFSRLVAGAKAIEAKVPFSRDDRLGFLTFCPTNLGTTIRASVHIKLPKLAADRKKLEEVASRYNLQVRGTSGEHTESVGGVYDISNKRRLGLTEYQAVREMQDGILELIKIEKSL